MKATLTNYRQAPRKVRLVADLVRGKSVSSARAALSFLPKKSAPAMRKLLESAMANARRSGASADALMVKSITVDKGISMPRYNPNKHNMSARLRKTASIVKIELGMASSGGEGAKKIQTVK